MTLGIRASPSPIRSSHLGSTLHLASECICRADGGDRRSHRGWPVAPRNPPVAPYNSDLKVAISKAFDRVTGSPIDPSQLQTYAEALLAYPNRPETKFLNGGAFDTGPTQRCHVIASEVKIIGKEADRWEEEYFQGLGGDMPIEYGSDPLTVEAVFGHLRRAIRRRSGNSKFPRQLALTAGPWQRSARGTGNYPNRASRHSSGSSQTLGR